MKYFLIILFLIGFAGSFLFGNYASAVPPLDSERIYEFSDTIIVGKVIFVNSTFSPTHNLYHIEVEKFLKNPKDNDVIFAAGQNTVYSRLSNQIFDEGDRALFFLQNSTIGYDQYSGILGIHYESQLIEPEWDECDIFSTDIPKEHWVFGGRGPMPKVQQQNNTDNNNFEIGKEVTLTYDIFNHTPNQLTVLVGMTIINRDYPDSLYVFTDTSSRSLEPCVPYRTLDWSFTPSKAGHYAAEFDNLMGSKMTIGFTVKESKADPQDSNSVDSPLKQFKSGIRYPDIQCKDGLELVMKNNRSAACVKPETKTKLIERGWAKGYQETISLTNLSCMTIEQSKDIAPFFKVPSYLPEGYSFRCSSSGMPFESYIIYHNKEVSGGWIANLHSLINDGAIFIYQIDERNSVGEKEFETYGSAEQRIQETYDSVMDGNPSLKPQLIRVNGMLAYAVDSCPDCGMQTANFTDGTVIQKSTSTETRIKFIDENGVKYTLETALPLSELIKVAESLQ